MLELLTGQHLLGMAEDVDLRKLGADLSALPPDKLELLEKAVEELGRLRSTAQQQESLAALAQRARSFDFGEVERIAAREVPEPTRFILHKLLRREPDERYATAAELEQALRERLHALGPYGAYEAAEEALLMEAEAAGLTAVPEDTSLRPAPARAPDEITTQPS
jgi:serine/threonine-protein kinase